MRHSKDIFDNRPRMAEASAPFADASVFAEPVGVQEGEKEPELPLWEADWDDEDVGGDFVQQLKAELGKSTSK